MTNGTGNSSNLPDHDTDIAVAGAGEMDPYSFKNSGNLRCATDGGIAFSSTKCPPPCANTMSGRLEQTCELPFGFCYTPMTRIPPQMVSSTSSPDLPSGVLCNICMTYLNLYCSFSETSMEATEGKYMMRWTCALCKSDNIVAMECSSNDVEEQRTTKLFDTMISQHVVEFRQSMSLPAMLPSSFATERDLSLLPTKTVILVMDENLPSNEAQAVGTALRNMLQESQQEGSFCWRIGLIVFGQSISIFQLGVSSGIVVADVVRSHEGFVVITGTDSGRDVVNRSYLGTSMNALITCLAAQFSGDENISKANVRNANIDESSKNTSNTEPVKTRLQLLKERKQFRLQQHEFESTGSINRNDTASHSPWTLARERIRRSKLPYRCTGDALQCAIDLASLNIGYISSPMTSADKTRGNTSEFHDTRILLFTNGCPNLGDGSVVDIGNDATGGLAAYSTVDATRLARACDYFDVIGKSAVNNGVGIDVFCTGSSELCFPAYLSLVEASSGYVLSHDTFESLRLQHNMGHVLQQTHMSQSYFPVQLDDEFEKLEVPQQQRLGGSWIDGCTVDIRMSSFLTSTHLIGPGDLIECPSEPLVNEEMAFVGGLILAETNKLTTDKNSPSIDLLSSTLTRIRIGRYDPLSTFSVMLRLNDSYQGDEHAFFQFVVRFVDVSRKTLVTRVTSHRVSVANDVGEFLEGIDEEVVPVLLAKEAVYRSMFGRDVDGDHPFHVAYIDELDSLAYDAQQDLDNTIFRISGAFRLLSLVQGTKSIDLTEEGGIKATGSSMDFAFPPELSDALRRLYHLRRGPLLSPGPVQSADDRSEMRSLFVRFPLDDCLSMMAPSLWSSGSPAHALDTDCNAFLQNVPPETLALWENHIIAADHWNKMFVWSGSDTLHPKYDVIREQLKIFLNAKSKTRFPLPNLYLLTEADSMSRRFTSLLGPSHGDPVEHQLAHFHALTLLSPDALAKLHCRFRFCDPDADPSFRKWFWDVASAASTCGVEGVSLCD